jgi:DNA-binding MarR family transcriptional regulator
MPTRTVSTNEAEHVSAMREFNRFYTMRLGLLRRRHLDGEFSLTEARILYEIGSTPKLTASSLRKTLGLDAGYISRLLTLLTRRKLVRQTASKEDGREKLLTLSTAGVKKLAQINERSALQIEELLDPLSAADRETVINSLSKVRSILSETQKPAVRIARLSEQLASFNATPPKPFNRSSATTLPAYGSLICEGKPPDALCFGGSLPFRSPESANVSTCGLKLGERGLRRRC